MHQPKHIDIGIDIKYEHLDDTHRIQNVTLFESLKRQTQSPMDHHHCYKSVF